MGHLHPPHLLSFGSMKKQAWREHECQARAEERPRTDEAQRRGNDCALRTPSFETEYG